MDYAFTHEGKAFTPNQTKVGPSEVDAHNAAQEAAELAVWATAPDRFAVYIVKKTDPTMRALNSAEWKPETWYIATTWRGVQLSKGRVAISRFSTNISRNMVAVRFQGTNGAEYHGRYGADWSQLCRVRKAKRASR
jgi:hypothetical protein